MLQLVPQAVAQDAGPFTFPGAQIIGVGDITQFIVKAAPVQTNNLVEIQDNGGTPLVTIDAAGQLGVGVTPTAIIDAQVDGGGAYVRVTSYRSNQYGGGFQFRHARGTAALPEISSNNDITMLMQGYGYASGFKSNAAIYFFVADVPTSTSMPGNILFYTTPSGSITPDLAFRIQANKDVWHYGNYVFQQASTISTTAGDLTISPAAQVYFTTNVGIGVAAPDAPLEISSTAAVHLHIDGLDSGVAEIQFTNTTDTDGWYIGITGAERWGISRNIDIDTGLEFIMLQTGEIGIGTLPSGQLHIDQATDDASIPVLVLDQADYSEEFTRYIGQSHDGVLTESLVEFGDEASSAGFAWIKVFIVDDNNQIADQAAYVLAYTLSA